MIHHSQTSIGVRIGLLAELQRRGLVEGDPHWLRLLRSTKGKDRLAVIYAAGVHSSPAVNAELIDILKGSDGAASAAAAIALGSLGNAAAVEPLSKAIVSENPRVAMAAIRGLGRIGTAEARAVLASAATSHPDASVRRRAEAELRVSEAHQGGSR
ncbi:MAG: HEAT repeat domain-containing protein [Deltaproteobacteria bacterium]|nr:HEAT repeat domain-containing protein [Deltaproteobacteria bacterium]